MQSKSELLKAKRDKARAITAAWRAANPPARTDEEKLALLVASGWRRTEIGITSKKNTVVRHYLYRTTVFTRAEVEWFLQHGEFVSREKLAMVDGKAVLLNNPTFDGDTQLW